jgi:hypothetical protein
MLAGWMLTGGAGAWADRSTAFHRSLNRAPIDFFRRHLPAETQP